ncbi:M16 family metallopeptidase [Marinomonas spartinae]|uniref:M16 family metallopeptidase n=1 Tax=Marinomonas spartinae TaxID=1792290 RepID=UPI0018F1500B|nr:M16 family metallopeptidase [Marinomonas spartinae]MBJ7556577.1 insulinase family protein [Marinomonas spartinae]
MTTSFKSKPTDNANEPFADINIPVTTFTLDNGLTVIVSENHDVPLVSLQLIYQVGSKDEPKGKTGFAHLFEHLMFEGSEHAQGSFLENMTRAGATNLNAFTEADNTTYHFTVPVGSLDYALFMESDRMGHFYNTINQQSLDQQRRVVLNEKMETEAGPYGKLYECKSKGCFPKDHPYAHTIIGEKDDLESATLEDIQQWFRTYYTPSNAVLALSGDIDLETACYKVTHWFGDIPPGPPITRPVSWIADISPQRRDRFQAKVANSTLMLIWNTPPAGTLDHTLFIIVADYLAAGISSLLIKKLVHEDNIASTIQAEVTNTSLCSQFIITATVSDNTRLTELEKRLLEEVNDFIKIGCDAEQLRQVKHDILITFDESYKTSAQIAALLSSTHVMLGDASAYKKLIEDVRQAQPEAIQRASQYWLTRPHYTLEIEAFSVQKDSAAIAADRSHPPAILPPKPTQMPAIQHALLDNGMKLVLLERHSNSDICLNLLLPKALQTRPGQYQLLLNLLEEAGADKKDAFEFNQSCRDIGCRIHLRNQLQHISLQLSCRVANFSDALKLFNDRIQHSILTEEDFLRQRLLLQNVLKEQKNTASAQALRVLPGLIYPRGHACRVAEGIEGTALSLTQTTLAELNQALPELLNVNGATLVVTGDTTLDELLLLLNQSIGKIPCRPRTIIPSPTVYPPTNTRVFLLDVPDAAQTSIIAASLIPGVAENKNEALFELLDTIFASGFTSRINMNLREEKNWTYGARGNLIDDPHHRVHYIQTEVQADKTCDAINEIRNEYEALTNQRPITKEELNTARDTTLLSFCSTIESLQGLNTMTSWLVRNDMPDDFWLHHQQQVGQACEQQINTLARTLFSIDQLTWVIAGDIKSFKQQLAEQFSPYSLNIITDSDNDLYD